MAQPRESAAQARDAGETPVLEARCLRKAYGDLVAVDDVSFHIAPGETYGLLGPNGAGKTTAIGMVCGLLTRDAGEVLIDGERLTTGSVRLKGEIGYVPQELIIIIGSSVFFGVNWGDLLAASALVLVFALASAGAGMLLGAVLGNEGQVVGIALLLGLGMAAFGGSMVLLEIFPDMMRTLAHVTPHAWGNEAFLTLLRHNGNIADIATEIGVLAAYAAGLLLISSWLLRRRIISV